MENWDELARYLAQRLRTLYDVSDDATEEELITIAHARGVYVFRSWSLQGYGYYVPRPEPMILLRWRAPRLVIAHELFHHLVEDNIEHDCDYDLPLVVYPYPDTSLRLDPLEEACNLFAELMCPGEIKQ